MLWMPDAARLSSGRLAGMLDGSTGKEAGSRKQEGHIPPSAQQGGARRHNGRILCMFSSAVLDA